MHLIIDGYNLLYVGRSPIRRDASELQRERDRLIDQLSSYRKLRPCEITLVFDGWQGGWTTEQRERKKGIELIFSRLGEKADDVIKRLVKAKGSGVVVVTSDREVSRFAERVGAAAIPSHRFQERIERSVLSFGKEAGEHDEEEKGGKRKGPARKPSKEERKAREALKKL